MVDLSQRNAKHHERCRGKAEKKTKAGWCILSPWTKASTWSSVGGSMDTSTIGGQGVPTSQVVSRSAWGRINLIVVMVGAKMTWSSTVSCISLTAQSTYWHHSFKDVAIYMFQLYWNKFLMAGGRLMVVELKQQHNWNSTSCCYWHSLYSGCGGRCKIRTGQLQVSATLHLLRVGTAFVRERWHTSTRHINIMSHVNRTIGTLGINCAGDKKGCHG